MGILDAVHDMQKRWETAQRRMIPGSLGGRTDSASPVTPIVSGPTVQRPQPAAAGGITTVGHFQADPVFVPHATNTLVTGLNPYFLLGTEVEVIGATSGIRFLAGGAGTAWGMQMHVRWQANASGVRHIEMTHTALFVNGQVWDTTPGTVTISIDDTAQSTPLAVFQPAANSIAAFTLEQDSGVDLNAEVHIYVVKLV